jgi:hypothetical protein
MRHFYLRVTASYSVVGWVYHVLARFAALSLTKLALLPLLRLLVLACTLYLFFPLRLLRLHPAFLSPAMDKQANQAEPTIEEIRKWNEDELLMQIQQKRPGLLRDGNLEKFREAFLNGDNFMDHANDVDFFEIKCHLPIGVSETLAWLAMEMAGGETTGTVQKGKEQDTS